MGYVVKINVDNIIRKQKVLMTKKLDKFTDIVKNEVYRKTPEDTKELLGNTQRSDVIDYGHKLHSRVFNETPYAKYVEYGVQGKIFNYHKPKGKVFYSGEGVGMFAKTSEQVRGNFYGLTK